MNDQQLQQISSSLKITLPDSYCKLMLSDPLEGKLRNKSSYSKLINDHREMITRNEILRESGFLNKVWPIHNVLIGYVWSEKNSEYFTIYFIDTRKPDGVWAVNVRDNYNPDRIGNLKSNSSLAEFIEMIKMHDSL